MKTIMEMAREVGAEEINADNNCCFDGFTAFSDKELKAFVELVRADAIAEEREACAKVCDELPAPDIYSDTDKSMWDVTCMDCAAAIRARSET